MHVFLPAGHAGPALQGTGRIRADRVVRPYDGSRSRAKRDVVPQGHLFRCAPLRDAVLYGWFSVPVRRAGPMCPAAQYACFPSGGARGPRPTGHRPCPGGQSRPPLRRVKKPCETGRRTQGHLFRCAPLRDAVPYTRLSTAHRSPVKAADFASCRWQTDDGVPCVRRGGLTMAGHKRRAFTSWGACALISLYLPPDMCWRRGSGRRSCSRPCRGRGAG